MTGERVLVTGANGMIGSELVHLLSEGEERELYATSFSEGRQEVPFYRADLTSSSETQALIRETKPDVIIHCAAISHLDQCEEDKTLCRAVNVNATENLLRAAQGAHFILLSTDMIFDGREGPYSEDSHPSPINEYGRTKVESEALVAGRAPTWSILRTALVYGTKKAHSRSNIIDLCRTRLLKDERLKLVSDQIRTPTFLPDLVSGIRSALMARAQGIFHLSGDELVSPFEMGLIVAKLVKRDTSLIEETITQHFPQPAMRPLRCGLEIGRAKRELSFAPTSLREGIEAVLSSY